MKLKEIREAIEIDYVKYENTSVQEFYELLKTYEKTLIDKGFRKDQIKIHMEYDYDNSWLEIYGVRQETVEEAVTRENIKLKKERDKLEKRRLKIEEEAKKLQKKLNELDEVPVE